MLIMVLQAVWNIEESVGSLTRKESDVAYETFMLRL
jgi:hypothetical protein